MSLASSRLRAVAVTSVTAVAASLLLLPTTTSADAAAAPAAPSAAETGPLGVVSKAPVGGLLVENSFVSSVGWVKPGEAYPSRILLTNTGSSPVSGPQVVVTAPTGTKFTAAGSGATVSDNGKEVTWSPSAVAATSTKTLVLESKAATLKAQPTLVWRDLSSKAKVTVGAATKTLTSHGPKVIPPGQIHESARYGDRPFPVVPVQYTDRDYQTTHERDLDTVINDPGFPGSTFNLFQEMSLGQLYPEGTVPSADLETAGFDYEPGFGFTRAERDQTCGGFTYETELTKAQDNPLYTERVTDGVYNLPGDTGYYGSDSNGTALTGAVAGVGALQDIDSGCGPTGKMVYDAAVIADPEIDYSDYDTDKDGVVDFFMAVFAGCGGNGSSQLSVAGCDYPGAAYDNVWPHSSSLEFYYSDPETGLPGYTTDDQLKNLENEELFYTDARRRDMTTSETEWPVFVRVGPYNVNPETAIDKASVISHEYGHSLGLPDFYSTGSRDTYGDWNLMATDKSQNIDAFGRQELGWVVPQVLDGDTRATGITDSKEDTGAITWQTRNGTPYTLEDGADGIVRNSEMYVAKLPGRQLLDPAKFETGDKASASHTWWSASGNDFGCATDGGGHNFDVAVPGLQDLPAGSTVTMELKSMWDIEWDYDYGYVLSSTDGGDTFASNESENGFTTSNTDPTSGNPNQNQCQATYDNGLTGTSGSYDGGSEAVDRKLGDYPESIFLADSYDLSELAGADNPVLRFSYATDPGLARPGWFIDDLKVTATTPSGETVLMDTDFESDGGPGDGRIFNGGCSPDFSTGGCGAGWTYVEAGSEATYDHAYYLEMRDRSGFDLDGNGQIDRADIGFEPGFYLSYTDEAHAYGNAGTDNPPAQSPLDSVPDPGNDNPDLNDAAFKAGADRSTFSDSGAGHTDNYSDPTTDSGNWEFRYNCLAFNVLSMSGDTDGPETADGDLTGAVNFTMGNGCGDYNYGYRTGGGGGNTAPDAKATATPAAARPGQDVQLSANGTTDADSPDDLDYVWDFGNGGDAKDATGKNVTHAYQQEGTYTATVTVTDPQGATDTASVDVVVSDNPVDATDPEAKISLDPARPFTTTRMTLSGARSSDDTSEGDDLTYQWNFKNGGAKVDATGREVTKKFKRAGYRTVALTVTDEAGNSDTATKRFLVRQLTRCRNSAVEKSGGWRVVQDDDANGGSYCDNRGRGTGKDVLTLDFSGPKIVVIHGDAKKGGKAVVFVDGEKQGRLSFRGDSRAIDFGQKLAFSGLGKGDHTIKVVMKRKRGFLEGFVTQG